MLEFKNKVGDDKSGINENDKKIDMSGGDTDEQEKIKNAMLNGNSADNSGDSEDSDDSDEDDSEGEDESESEEEESAEDDSDDDEEDESEEDSLGDEDQEESEKDSEDDKSEDDKEDKKTGQFDGFDTFEEYKAAQAEKANKSEVKEEFDSSSSDEDKKAAAQHKEVLGFFKEHSDVISESTIENYKKFYDSGNNAFLHLDNDLYKITQEMKNINPELPVKEKLERAYFLVFREKLAKLESKKATFSAEFKAQKVNKSASTSINSSSDKKKKIHTPEQLAIMERWGLLKKDKK